MVVPFVGCIVEDGDAADAEFADVGGKRGLGADGAEEGRPT